VLEVRLNDEITSRREFCVGDQVTLVCSIDNTVTFQWLVPGLLESNNGAAVIGNPAITANTNGQAFTVGANGTAPNTTSTLMFTVSNLLDEKSISCGPAGSAATNSQVISVFGKCCP